MTASAALVAAQVGVLAGLAVLLLLPAHANLGGPGDDRTGEPGGPPGPTDRARRYRPALAVLAGLGVHTVLGGMTGVVAGVVGGALAWVALGRAEPASARREREQVRRDLPAVVTLLAAALRSGAAPAAALAVVADAFPSVASARLRAVTAQLALGGDPATAWAGLEAEPALAPLGRALARSQRGGTPVVTAVERLAEELARQSRAEQEDRARAVGVKAAVPLGLCLLPAFVLIGIVPLVAALLAGLAW